MAEENGTATEANGSDNQPAIGLLSQYVKDLSVENPNAPQSFNWQGQPQIDISVNIGVDNVSDELHEVSLKLDVKAEMEEGVFFAVELLFCGLFGIRNVPEDQMHPFLFSEAPRLIFPFARRVLADATRDAGHQPLLLDPIDFNALYLQQRAEQQAGAGEASVEG